LERKFVNRALNTSRLVARATFSRQGASSESGDRSVFDESRKMRRPEPFSTGEDFFVYCRDAFDWLYRLGIEGRPRMLTISLHNRIIGRPGRIGALAHLLDHIQRHDAVWLCNRTAIARHWIQHHAAHEPAADPGGA
jgi:hypothetical protein